ncbi:hypothetical protein TWF106_011022 [Orbilia oligospora]|uniref:F-box domain-containing protein n=1 Tax=Orbilia oligospora TaxID=2813651 RepID=A0A6G1MF51_ORBOL|nr:hypothetical protein TWF788_008297 [Orbilia oligospora]KAF3201216.1 hypothetical protein TWF679_011435 [Orbilia oligospora]KAF3209204.1 hypothetical protein TWF106_011022 [Orbilia oligospora]KAF3225720.1 hypothetical protein TWF191_005066 [Orbilia oligospora]KAF3254910.1 hypothetical protein TWF192_002993 [Orbilia oligospora]
MDPTLEIGEPSFLLNLPVEILQQIIETTGHSYWYTLKELRLVNHIISDLATPLLFGKYTLSLKHIRGHGQNLAERVAPEKQIELIRKIEAIKSLEGLEFLTSNVQDLNISAYQIRDAVKFLYEESIQQHTDDFSPLGVQILQNFICSMKRLKTLRWNISFCNLSREIDFSPIASSVTRLELHPMIDMDPYDPPSAQYDSYPSFKVFTNLTHLTLLLWDKKYLDTLNYLPRLKSLTFEPSYEFDITAFDFLEVQQVPFNLEELTLKYGTINDPFPEHLIPKFLSNLKRLTSRTELRPESTVKRPIWDCLREHGIFLTHVSEHNASRTLLNYLSSYSNTLTSLSIHMIPYRCGRTATKELCTAEHNAMLEFMNEFWQDVIPKHASTLKRLKMFPGNQHIRSGEGPGKEEQHRMVEQLNLLEPWSLGNHIPAAKKALMMCEKLEELQMGSAGEVGFKEAIEVAVRSKRVEKLTFNLKGYAVRPQMRGWCGTGMMGFLNEAMGMRKRILGVRWESSGVPEGRWGKVDIEVVPVGKLSLIKEKGEEGLFKLIDFKDLIKATSSAEDVSTTKEVDVQNS